MCASVSLTVASVNPSSHQSNSRGVLQPALIDQSINCRRCSPVPPAHRPSTSCAVQGHPPHAEPQTFCSPMVSMGERVQRSRGGYRRQRGGGAARKAASAALHVTVAERARSLSTTDSCGRAGHRCKAWPHEQGVDVAGPHPSPMPRRPPSPFPPLATRARTVAAPRHPPSLPSRRLGQAFTVCGEPAPAPARRGSPHARTRSAPIGTAQAPAVLTLLCHPLLAPMLAASTPDGSGGRSGASSPTDSAHDSLGRAGSSSTGGALQSLGSGLTVSGGHPNVFVR